MVNLWDPAKQGAFEAHDQLTRELHKQYLEHLHNKPELNLKRIRKEIQREESLNKLEVNPLPEISTNFEDVITPEKRSLTNLEEKTEKEPDEENIKSESLLTLHENVETNLNFSNAENNIDVFPAPLRIKAVDERSHLEEESRKANFFKILYRVISFVGSIFLSLSIGWKLAPYVGRLLPFSPPTWFSSLIIISLLTFFTAFPGWQLAKAYQIRREQKRLQSNPEIEIAEILLIKNILKKEKELSIEELKEELQTHIWLRWENKRLEDVDIEIKISGALLSIILVTHLFFNIFQFGGNTDGMQMGIALSVLGAVALIGTLIPLASVSLNNKEIPSFTVYDPIEAKQKLEEKVKEQEKKSAKEQQLAQLKAENERIDINRKAEQDKQLEEQKQRAEQAQREKQQSIFLAAKIEESEEQHKDSYQKDSKEYEKKRNELYIRLRDSVSQWEMLRGFNLHELEYMIGLKRHHQRIFGVFAGFSIPISLLATYPASIVTTELLDLSYIYTAFGKIGAASWAIWTVLVLLAEWFLSAQLVKRRTANYEYQVLMQGYDINQRKKGLCYKILDQHGLQQRIRFTMLFIFLCVIGLTLELIVNILYIINYADSSWMAYAISFVPLIILVLFAFLAAEQKEPLSYLHDILGYGKVDINHLKQQPNRNKDISRPPTSRDLIHEIEDNIGPRPLGEGRKKFGKNK